MTVSAGKKVNHADYRFQIGSYSTRPLVRVPSDILEKKEVVVPNVGDMVYYSPSGSYNWNAEYATSYLTSDSNYESITISSNNRENYRLTNWKVLNVDKETGKIDIVPTGPTTNFVNLQGAQGYNNAVYLLNEACNSLYSDKSKGITARSINIEDIENALKEAGNESAIKEPTQPYTGTFDSYSSKYPVIYGEEKLSKVNSLGTLGLSEQTRLIERIEGTSTSSYIGAITSLSALTRQLYLTYYEITSGFNTLLGSKGNILVPKGNRTNYWVASRCYRGRMFLCSHCE